MAGGGNNCWKVYAFSNQSGAVKWFAFEEFCQIRSGGSCFGRVVAMLLEGLEHLTAEVAALTARL
jgi:hypothetical protein